MAQELIRRLFLEILKIEVIVKHAIPNDKRSAERQKTKSGQKGGRTIYNSDSPPPIVDNGLRREVTRC